MGDYGLGTPGGAKGSNAFPTIALCVTAEAGIARRRSYSQCLVFSNGHPGLLFALVDPIKS
jgi:hypothetical protein